MAAAQELLGKHYGELGHCALLLGRQIPELERISDRSYLAFPDLGLSLAFFDNESVGAVQLHRDRHEGFSGFAGQLPLGLKFSADRESVRRRLGPPEKSGEEQLIPVLGKKSAWDRFRVPEGYLHVEYCFGVNGIGLVSLISKEVE